MSFLLIHVLEPIGGIEDDDEEDEDEDEEQEQEQEQEAEGIAYEDEEQVWHFLCCARKRTLPPRRRLRYLPRQLNNQLQFTALGIFSRAGNE